MKDGRNLGEWGQGPRGREKKGGESEERKEEKRSEGEEWNLELILASSMNSLKAPSKVLISPLPFSAIMGWELHEDLIDHN